MKKRWMMAGVAGLLSLIALALLGIGEQPTEVSVMTVEPSRVEQTVSCMGVVESADTTAIMLPINCSFHQVKVKAGDRVKKGDVLAVVDKDATRKMQFDSATLMALAALPDEVTAPESGTILEVKASEQQAMDATVPCITMAADKDLQIRIAIREKDLKTLKEGMQVRITGDGFQRVSYAGELSYISSAARKDENGTVVEGLVTLTEQEVDASLRLGLTAKAAIVTAVTEFGYVVPYEAVKTDESGSYVYVVEDGRAQKYDITVAAQVAQGVLLKEEVLAYKRIVCDAECIKRNGQNVKSRGSDL